MPAPATRPEGATGYSDVDLRPRKHKSPAQRIETKPTRHGPRFGDPGTPKALFKKVSGPVDYLSWHSIGCATGCGANLGPAGHGGPVDAAVAAVAILVMRQLHLVAQTPIWLVPAILGVGQLVTTATGIGWHRHGQRARLHLWIASQAIVVTATIYATGWGPALGIGLVLIGQETLVAAGTSSERVIVGWTLACLGTGQVLVASVGRRR